MYQYRKPHNSFKKAIEKPLLTKLPFTANEQYIKLFRIIERYLSSIYCISSFEIFYRQKRGDFVKQA